MIKWFKKHCKKLIIASSILTACICGLFGFTKSYAYSENQNGELVGNNLITDTNLTNITMNARFTNIDGNYNYNLNGNFYFNLEFNNYQGSDQCNILLEFNNFTPSYFIDKKFSLGILAESTNFSIGNYQTSLYCTGGFRRDGTTNDYVNQVILNESFIASYSGDYKKCYFVPFDSGNWNSYPNSHFRIYFRLNNNANNIVNGSLRFTFFMFENSSLSDLSFNSNLQTFYPYSSIIELQEAYDNLQQQYNDYTSTHSYTNTQYNDLVSANSSLQQQLSSLQLQYDTYVATHSHTDEEYNTLQQNYNNLNNTLIQLQQDYNDLQSRYDILLSEYNKIYYNQNHGFWNYINNVDFYSGEYHSGLKTLDDLLNDEIITYLNFDLALGFRKYVESIPSYVYVDVDFIDNVVPISVFNIKVVDIITPYTFSFTLYDKLNDDTVIVSVSTQDVSNNYISGYEIMKAYFGNDYTLDEYNDAVEKNPYVYIQDFLLDSTYSTSGDVYDPSLESGVGIDGDSYQFGYNQGYATAYSNYVDTYASNSQLETQNVQLSFQVNQLQHDISVSSSAYQSLLNSYNNLVEGRSDLPTLFFTIAQTPFETFKTIWNVDFLGINLAGFFTGIIMLGLMIWVIKKIF